MLRVPEPHSALDAGDSTPRGRSASTATSGRKGRRSWMALALTRWRERWPPPAAPPARPCSARVSACSWPAAGATRPPTARRWGRSCDQNNDCCTGAECRGGECQCKSGREECDGKCFNLDTDERHCGDCPTACAKGQTCCDGACVDLESNGDHCGSCDAVCTASQGCCAGTCVDDLASNRDHCGACGNRCPGICGSGGCHGPRCCSDGECVEDVQSNPDHCGACGNRCPGICGPGGCHGPRCCGDGACVEDVQSNPDHCGACGHACAPDEACCDGTCVNLDTTDAHCGACGHACPEIVGARLLRRCVQVTSTRWTTAAPATPPVPRARTGAPSVACAASPVSWTPASRIAA